jgi:hypothetical protein
VPKVQQRLPLACGLVQPQQKLQGHERNFHRSTAISIVSRDIRKPTNKQTTIT